METSRDADRLFGRYRGEKIALYGLGTETQKALVKLNGAFKIIGLLDSFNTDGRLYGQQIISFDEAVRAGVRLIIVVARPGSCRAIAKRIAEECREQGIDLLDIRGKNLLETKKASYQFSDQFCDVNGVTKAEIEEKIERADVVSFDMFDTLVMRRTLYPDDVAEYVDCRLREKGICIEDFCKKRLAGEKELSRNTAPALIDIYQNVLEKLETDTTPDITAAQLADMEWDVDFHLLVPRKEVCDLFRRTAERGKKVYVVSDTYYSQKQLEQILRKCGITAYTDIIASSDYGTGKSQGLYQVLRDREETEKRVHIGDDIVTDLQCASRFGFETCRLPGGLELLEGLGGLGVQDYLDSLSDRLKMGMFVSRIFNTPFLFENGENHIEIPAAFDVGYLLCAPLISDFVLWFYDHMQSGQYQNIWFSARDGYLVRKMYAYLMKASGQEDQSVYFLTSRIAAIRAGVNGQKDIQYVDEMQYSGTLEEKLLERFGIDAKDAGPACSSAGETGLMKYQVPILEKAQKVSANYLKYIEKLNLNDGNIAFFDFVAKGTTQLYLQKMIDNRLRGFYFLQLEKSHMSGRDLDIQSFCEDGENDACAVYNNYYILETVLTAPHPSVQEFDHMGEPVYAVETRTDRDISCFEQVQDGIFEYFKTYIALCPKARRTINRKLDGILLELVHEVRITDRDFMGFVVEDSFFNRMTKITDVV